MTTLLWHQLRHHVARLAWPGWLGSVALVLAVIAGGISLGPLAGDNLERAGALETSRERLARVRASPTSTAPVESVQTLLDALPPSAQANGFVERVQDEATRRGMQIESAEYKVEALPDARVVRYQLLFPVRGDYRALRTWLDAVLTEHPSAALDELAVRRDADGSAALSARVVFSYYMRAAQ